MKNNWKQYNETYYWFNEIGEIKTTSNHGGKKVIKQYKDTHGYLSFSLCDGGKNKTTLVHIILAKLFIAPIEGKNCINHIDGNKLNNRVDNLEWCTYKENIIHAFNNGLINLPMGEHRPQSKWNDLQILFMFCLKFDGYKYKEIQDIFGITILPHIACGRSRSYLQPEIKKIYKGFL